MNCEGLKTRRKRGGGIATRRFYSERNGLFFSSILVALYTARILFKNFPGALLQYALVWTQQDVHLIAIN
jgi:hypothetical protein